MLLHLEPSAAAVAAVSVAAAAVAAKKDYDLKQTTGSVGLKSKVKPPIHPPHNYPLPGTPYQHSGSTGGPIRPPKQQYIPPKRSIFPERPQLWVTTGSVGLKSKVKPPIHPPHPHPSQGTPYQHSGTTGGPIRLPKQQYIPPKQSIFPERP